MPRVTHVKSARKANPRYGIEVGDSYYHWAFMVGGRGGSKICSKTKPTRSQLTNSDFYKSLYGFYDDSVTNCEPKPDVPTADFDSLPDDIESLAEELRQIGQEQQDKFDNMPDGLQQGDTGQMIEQRAQGCEAAADEIDQAASTLRSALEEIDGDEDKSDDEKDEARRDAVTEAFEAIVGTEDQCEG